LIQSQAAAARGIEHGRPAGALPFRSGPHLAEDQLVRTPALPLANLSHPVGDGKRTLGSRIFEQAKEQEGALTSPSMNQHRLLLANAPLECGALHEKLLIEVPA